MLKAHLRKRRFPFKIKLLPRNRTPYKRLRETVKERDCSTWNVDGTKARDTRPSVMRNSDGWQAYALPSTDRRLHESQVLQVNGAASPLRIIAGKTRALGVGLPVPLEVHLRFGTPTPFVRDVRWEKKTEREKKNEKKQREREKEGWIVGRSMKRERVKITNGWIKATRKVVWWKRRGRERERERWKEKKGTASRTARREGRKEEDGVTWSGWGEARRRWARGKVR